MKVLLSIEYIIRTNLIDTEKDNPEEIITVIQTIYKKENNTSSTNQSTLTNNNNKPDPKICSKCGINIFDKYNDKEATKIINYCKYKYKKTLCKDCQEKQ